MYQCDECKQQVPYADFEVRVWKCRACAGPGWKITVRRFVEFFSLCGMLTCLFALFGIMLLSSVGVIAAMISGVVLGWVGVVALLIWKDDNQ